MSGCVANIICITQVTRKGICNALLIYDWRLDFFWLQILLQFLADKYVLQSSVNVMTEITHLSSNRVSGPLLLERENYSERTLLSSTCVSLPLDEMLWINLLMVEFIIVVQGCQLPRIIQETLVWNLPINRRTLSFLVRTDFNNNNISNTLCCLSYFNIDNNKIRTFHKLL